MQRTPAIGSYYHISDREFCTNSLIQGDLDCLSQDGAFVGAEYCGSDDSSTAGPSYPDWDPGASIALVNGVYEVDEDLIDTVRSDFRVLTEADSARMKIPAIAAGYARLVNVSETDMVYHLGFRNNDIVQAAGCGYYNIPLTDRDAYVYAAAFCMNESEIAVTVLRVLSVSELQIPTELVPVVLKYRRV